MGKGMNMSRRGLFRVLAMAVLAVWMLVFSGVLSAQGRSDQAFERVREVQERHTAKLLAKQGVVGTAVGLDDAGGHVVLVLLERAGVPEIPAELDGVPVRPLVTGAIHALGKPTTPPGQDKKSPKPPAAPTSLTATAVSSSRIDLRWIDNARNETGFKIERLDDRNFGQIAVVGANVRTYSDTGLEPSTSYTYRVRAYNSAGHSAYSNAASATTPGSVEPPIGPRPAPIGVSTGHPRITAGTIGCRVTKGNNVYALSNNHVYADENRASIDDNVLQPGPADGGEDPRDAIGTLAEFEPIKFDGSDNTIDAAIALSSTANLGNSTPADGYGTPSTEPATPLLHMEVKKYGRTTGLTTGTIVGVNSIVEVGYSTGTARFVGQSLIYHGSTFSAGGDSGSLIVTRNGNHPVGLLFAGSPAYTVANPIQAVLDRFGVTVDGL